MKKTSKRAAGDPVNLTYSGVVAHEQPGLRLNWDPGQTQTVSAEVAAALQAEYPSSYREQEATDEEQPATEAAPVRDAGEETA